MANKRLTRLQAHMTTSASTTQTPLTSQLDTVVTDTVDNITDTIEKVCIDDTTLTPNPFVRTTVFRELEKQISSFPVPGHLWRAIFLVGSKGLGKSWAMEELCRNNCGYYVDIGCEGVNFEVLKSCDYLFLDNAQKFKDETIPINISLPKYVVAAFSPGIDQTGYKILRKRVGDGRYFKFYYRPFTLSEAEVLVKTRHFTIIESEGEDETSDYEKKTILRQDFNYMYSVTNGNPRHIVSYLRQFKFSFMRQEVFEQFDQSRDKDVFAVVGSDAAQQVDKSILRFVLRKSCDSSSIIVRLGLAYCTEFMGDSQFKISSLYYVKKALENIREFVCDDWHRLEAATQLMILCGPCQATLDKKKYTIPPATKQIVQKEIGDLPELGEISEGVVTLLKLASQHNVVDFVLYDRRGTPVCVYFIQTSISNYGINKAKKEDKAALSNKVMSGSTEKSAVSIEKYYSASFEEPNIRYVFATTDLRGIDNNPEVIFLSLLQFLSVANSELLPNN